MEKLIQPYIPNHKGSGGLRQFDKNKQAFTLIELVMVLVIISILSVFILPKFIDLKRA